jgi:drug/metabolite transporter (DMT)-like permease
MPVAVLLTSWALRVEEVNFMKLFNVSFIVLGVVIASFGEIDFVLAGFLYQLAGLIFEAVRINLVQTLLNGAEYKMDPLVSLYYFAPVCAVMNTIVALFLEVPQVTMAEFNAVGVPIFIANALCAFLLNVAVVFLVSLQPKSSCSFNNKLTELQIGKTSGLVLTLCGVLKDILLVIASVLIWGTMISHLQMFGYSIALLGMLWFKFGKEKIKEYMTQGGRAWAELGANRPVLRKLLILGLVVVTIFVLLGGLAPSYDIKDSFSATKNALTGAGTAA